MGLPVSRVCKHVVDGGLRFLVGAVPSMGVPGPLPAEGWILVGPVT